MTEFVCCSLDRQAVKRFEEDFDEEWVSQFLRLVGHPLRLRILRLLVREGQVCTCDLTDLFGTSQPQVSKHLVKMREEGLLECEVFTQKGVRGRWHIYRLVGKHEQLVQDLLSLFVRAEVCGDEKQELPPACAP